MHQSTTEAHSHCAEGRLDHASDLRLLIEHVAHLLPAQGPITVFVHHNTLHAFEHLPFEEALRQGARTFGCQVYLAEDQYRQELARGRIRLEDIHAALLEELGPRADGLVGFMGTRFHLRLAMLQYPLRLAPGVELRWLVAETDALRRFRDDATAAHRERILQETRRWVMRDLRNGHREPATGDRRIQHLSADLFKHFGQATIENWSEATWESFCLHLLWRICHNGVHGIHSFQPAPPTPVRHRDLLLEATGEDSDQLVHDVLIRSCAAFLDQGMASWTLPDRDRGFYRGFLALYSQPGGPPDTWLRGLRRELQRLDRAGIGPLESIEESLELLGVAADEREAFLSATLLALRGWAGMVWHTETRGDRVAHPSPPGSLVEFLAVRLILEQLALAHLAREALDYGGPLCDLRKAIRSSTARPESVHVEQRAFLVFQLAQVLGWLPQDLYRLTKQEWSLLLQEVESFSGLERRRTFHLAYERRYRLQTLDAVATHVRRRRRPTEPPPRFQVVCCIDEREESFRRHLEELAPDCETLSAAGFFAVAMYYRGVADAHYIPLCPVIVRPRHYVREEVVVTFEEEHRRRTRTRRALGMALHRAHVGSRTFSGGALAALLGSLASVPLIARVLFPRFTAQIRRLFGRFVQTPPVTQLVIERSTPEPGPEDGQVGYTVEEMADVVERVLRDLGLTANFARLVIITGHGSSSLNNPHESAHDCGACSGARGGPNARAFARMANDPRVRQVLTRRGLALPADVVFVGAYHNTCDDSMTYFALDRLPVSHRDDFARAREVIDQARERNAHERCRRFESAPLKLSPEAALRHVEARAEDLAQTRPEYGHCTNALCLVGRRQRTRGLFLDRRAFLNSYDPDQDDAEHTILTRILQAAIPVCAGISLEYYFSFTDPTGWGCGTKLPHNIASLLGVMDGAASDLRTGLPWQMVEIHEPVRCLFVIETTPEAMLRIMERDAGIGQLCRNGWVQLATLDPHSPRLHVYRDGRFVPYQPESTDLPEVPSSVDWYRGWRDHLGFASVRDGASSQDRASRNGERESHT
jgi:uncharacterized protein YbcC (UPF0753/DUF2309 family)